MATFDLYQCVTDKIVAMLEQGVAPCRNPIMGRGKAGVPKNLVSGKSYRGINTFLLGYTAYAEGFDSSFWCTFQQAKEHGGSVRRGQKSTLVVFWREFETKDKATGEDKKLPVMRFYHLFNLAQCDGIAKPDAVPFTPSQFTPIEAAEAIVKGYADGPAIEHGGTQAYYRPSTDTVKAPEPSRFTQSEEYFSTLFHELGHSSGHSKRLDRGVDQDTAPFGSAIYSKEELTAEMAACYLTAHAGISPAVIENQTAYLAGWVKVLKGDKRLIISAASAAQKAADWIRGIRGQPVP